MTHTEPAVSALRITAVICNYNYAGYVEEAVESVLRQEPPPEQLIIVDDGSSDRSRELLEQRYSGNPRVRLLFKPNGGQLSAFVAAAAIADGDLLCFLDADDRWRPGYLQRLRALYASRPDVDFVYGNLRFFGGLDEACWFAPDEPDRFHGYTVLETWVIGRWRGAPTSALSLRTPIARKLLSLPEALWEDWRTRADDVLVFGAGIFGARKYFLSEVVADYRVHASNSWLRAEPVVQRRFEYELRKWRLIEHFARDRGLGASHLRLLYLEFCSKDRPSNRELASYLKALSRSARRLGFLKSARTLVELFHHQLRSRLKPLADGKADGRIAVRKL